MQKSLCGFTQILSLRDVFFAHKFHKYHECLSLRDRFFSHRLHRFYRFFILIIRFALLLCKNRSADLHRFYRCAMFFFAHKFHKYHEYLSLRDGFLDVLEELGRCAVLDFAVWRFSLGVLSFTELTEYTEFFYFRTRCLTSSNALDGTHGVYI